VETVSFRKSCLTVYFLEIKPSNQSQTFIFVGDKQVGKSSLINKVLDIQLSQNSAPKETIGLDYKFAAKSHEEWKTKVNTYELGGGRILSNLL